jgi:hypothetical protein
MWELNAPDTAVYRALSFKRIPRWVPKTLSRVSEPYLACRITVPTPTPKSAAALRFLPNIERAAVFGNLKKLEHVKGGFNIFRRFRITELKKSDCPDALQRYWSGHAQTHVSERYTKLFSDRDYRLEWAEKIGMGFDLPARPGSQLSKLIEFRRVA